MTSRALVRGSHELSYGTGDRFKSLVANDV
jgi:hypothetical protein